MRQDAHDRREALAAALGAGLLLGSGAPAHAAPPAPPKPGKGGGPPKGRGAGQEKDTPAVEDLMREHGVLRRALLVYVDAAGRLRRGQPVDAPALHRTAALFRRFGEDYHEEKLEEGYIFPIVAKAGGEQARLVDVLKHQHDRGREVTGYVLDVTKSGRLATGRAAPLAEVLSSFVLMYQHHAAREDTVVFPAWKTALPQARIDELGDKFEDIERQTFGHDGFEDALHQMEAIEHAMGLSDLARFTPPPPPKA